MSCSCGTCTGCLNTDTISIPTGANGQDGSNGVFGGFSGSWIFSDSTSTGPSTTTMRFNSADLTAATELYAHDNNADSVDHTAFLGSFANAIGGTDYFGTVRIWKRLDSTKFWMGSVTSVTNNGADFTFEVTYLENNGAFTAADELVISFTANGASGAAGGSNVSGGVVDTKFDTVIAASTAAGTLEFLSLPANTLSTDEDMIEFSAVITRATRGATDVLNFSFGAQGFALDGAEAFSVFAMKDTAQYIHVKGIIHRESSVKAHCEIRHYSAGFSPTGTIAAAVQLSTIGDDDVTIDWTQINLLQLNNQGTTSGEFTIESLSMKYTKRIS